MNKEDLELLSHELHTQKDLIDFIEIENNIMNQNHKKNYNEEDNSINYSLKRLEICNKTVEILRGVDKILVYEFNTMKQRYYGNNLKLLLWVSIPNSTQRFFNLKKLNHFGRHIIVKPLNSNRSNNDNNIDVKNLNFFGSVIHA